MPIPTLGAISGDDITALIESLEKQRKELEFVLSSLDSSNVLELNAEVINAGRIKSEFIQIGADTEFAPGFDPNAALQVAQDAFDQAFETGEVVDLWKYPGTTLINGGNIFTNSITANKLNVSSLSAISANIGTITAGTITTDTQINVGTDLYVGNNIYMKYSYADRFNDKELVFYDGSALESNSLFDTKIKGTYLVLDAIAYTVRLKGKSQIDIDAPTTRFGGNIVDFSAVTVNGLSGYSLVNHTHSEYSVSGHVHSGNSYVKPNSGQAITLGAGPSTLNVYVDGSLMGTIPYS